MTETISSTAWYVYAFVGPPPDVRALEDLHGVSEGGLALVGDDSLAAVVGGVSLHEFGETTLPERLNDRGWLEEKARAHEHVVEQLGAATTVVPLRFGSIYRELSDVEALVERRRADVGLILEHIRGRMELGVQAWLAGRTIETAGKPATTGRAYLEQRRAEQARAGEAASRLEQVLRDAHERLLGLAVDGVVNRPQPRELTGRDDEMVFNAAYLVPSGDEALGREVTAIDGEQRDRGLRFELTGPWPPHNFVELDENA